MVHYIKILESFATAVNNGDKTFEVRQNDRGYQKGDTVKFTVLHDYDKLKNLTHPLNETLKDMEGAENESNSV